LVKYNFPKYQLVLDIEDDIYFPAEDTFALIDVINLERDSKFVVEIGSGTGIISIVLAKRYPDIRFLITDISFKAMKNIQHNLEINEIRNQVDLICMDQLEATNHIYPDTIIWNPPYLPEIRETENLKALDRLMLIGGNKGFEQAYSFIKYLYANMKKVTFFTIFSSMGVTEDTFNQMKEEDINFEICGELKLFFEKLYLVKVNVGEKNRNQTKVES